MILLKRTKTPTRDLQTSTPGDDRWLLADLEAAQRRDLYAAGHGDGGTASRRWSIRRAKRS